MTLTPFADFVHLNTDRIAAPAAAGIERFIIGAVETASQYKQVLRTSSAHPESDLSDFHALRRDFNPRRTAPPKATMTLIRCADLVYLNTDRIVG
jgi:hypothetical protein